MKPPDRPDDEWVKFHEPSLSAHQFSLTPLQPLARFEMLHVLQLRDDRGQFPLRPTNIRQAVRFLKGIHSLIVQSESEDGLPKVTSGGVHSFIKELGEDLRRSFDRSRGIEETDKLVWDIIALPERLPSKQSLTGFRRHSGSIDFTEIQQVWLRELAMHWVKTVLPDGHELRLGLRAAGIASRALATRPGGGHDPAVLGYADMTAVVDGFKTAPQKDGSPVAYKQRARWLHHFLSVIDFGRREGVLDGLSSRFTRHREHRIDWVDAEEDEIGKAIPESVIRQLDRQLHLLGWQAYGGMAPEHVHAMFRTAYVILRDTGRRPLEVAGLDLNCLRYNSGEYELIWHNFKGKRLRRTLPMAGMEAVSAIKEWQALRATIDVPKKSAPFLFPTLTDKTASAHLPTGYISKAIRAWIDGLPGLDSEEPGPDGSPLPFDRSAIFPYAFRHTFCQRYADAGVEPHVLQALMDHKSAETTGTYYRVPAKMKREAINTVRRLATDRYGSPAPIGSATAYELGSVAVPFGNCIEPSNVKAGGKQCPIRFQCAGCGSYRPDPSYLPAIEEHVRALKADREAAIAMGAAEYVVRNFEDQIAAFQAVRETQQKNLASMPEEMRHEVEEASKVLRKLRAGASGAAVSLGMPTVGPPEEAA
ncbi:tyrosine-type recombinase/integrase [Kitasatospora sp. NPDC086801]|uniref:tyrosine-type recombinase/integrase n=1 Tax=Kitasatospora sp. NPDC086801 TaxID=3364066 RepID=UPI00380708A2